MSSSAQPGLRVVVLLIAISVPLLLGIETLLRIYVLGPLYGPLLTELRALYWPALSDELLAARATKLATILIGVTLVAGVLGLMLLQWTTQRAAAAASERPAVAKVRDQLLLMTSIPQVPGLLSTLCLAAGAELTPVLICVGVSTAFVIMQGFVGQRALDRMEPPVGRDSFSPDRDPDAK